MRQRNASVAGRYYAIKGVPTSSSTLALGLGYKEKIANYL